MFLLITLSLSSRWSHYLIHGCYGTESLQSASRDSFLTVYRSAWQIFKSCPSSIGVNFCLVQPDYVPITLVSVVAQHSCIGFHSSARFSVTTKTLLWVMMGPILGTLKWEYTLDETPVHHKASHTHSHLDTWCSQSTLAWFGRKQVNLDEAHTKVCTYLLKGFFSWCYSHWIPFGVFWSLNVELIIKKNLLCR